MPNRELDQFEIEDFCRDYGKYKIYFLRFKSNLEKNLTVSQGNISKSNGPRFFFNQFKIALSLKRLILSHESSPQLFVQRIHFC